MGGSPFLHAGVEGLLALEYITEADSDRRAASWWVAYMQNARKTMEMHDPRTSRAKDLMAAVRKDKSIGTWSPLAADVQIDKVYQGYEKSLAHPRYQAANIEYEGVKKAIGRDPNWFQLFGGPRTISQLASHLRRGGLYQLLYREWSNVVHPMNLARWMRTGGGFPPKVTSLRDIKVLPDVAFYAATLTTEAIAAMGVFFALEPSDYQLLDAYYGSLMEELRQWPRR